MKKLKLSILYAFSSLFIANSQAVTNAGGEEVTLRAGHPSLQYWLLPDTPPAPDDNKNNSVRTELGKMLFFEPRLSGDRNMSCATCHNPSLGWSDNFTTAKGVQSKILPRSTPTIVNTAYNTIQMWDGRSSTLEDQAIGPLENKLEMNSPFPDVIDWLKSVDEYRELFAKAYPDEAIDKKTLAKALASYERTIISHNSPFDRWIKGDKEAMTKQQINGFKVFLEAKCDICHSAPNFTDNGFHNLGIKKAQEDVGRFKFLPIPILKGAFKTPTLRDVATNPPYFHDGSAVTLMDVVEHYVRGGDDKSNLSPNMQKQIDLSEQEKADLVAFMEALTSPPIRVELPILPRS